MANISFCLQMEENLIWEQLYEYMDVIKESKGMLWIGQPTDGNGYDLIDWHGNVLLTGSSGYSSQKTEAISFPRKDTPHPLSIW